MSQVKIDEPESLNWFQKLAQQLSVFTVIIIIAGGVLTCLLLFIFAKRQIMRFAIRSHRGPHVLIGSDANKTIKKEINRRIEGLKKIVYEPKLLQDEVSNNETYVRPCHYFRMRAVDDTKILEQSIESKKLEKRQIFESLRSYLIKTLTPKVDPRIVHQFSDLYEAARFNPKPFNEEEYKIFSQLLKQLRTEIILLQPRPSLNKSPGKHSGGSVKNLGGVNLLEDDSFKMRMRKPDKKTLWKNSTNKTNAEEVQELCDTSSPNQLSLNLFIKSTSEEKATNV